MKINWGTGIVIGFILFIGFIVTLVVIMVQTSEHQLVTKDYYQKELDYQNEIDAETNANFLVENIKIENNKQGITLFFPSEFNPQDIEGTVTFYRPSNQKLDFEIPIKLSSLKLNIPTERLVEGAWNITVSWKYNNTPYLYKEEIMY